MNDNIKEKKMSNLEYVNYYNDKIKENKLLCRIRNIVCIILFFIASILDSFFPNIIIFTYVVWWIITFIMRNTYKRKQLIYAKDESYIECEICKNYKLANKKCENCDNDRCLTDDEIIEEIHKVESKKSKFITVGVLLLIVFVILCGTISPTKPVYEYVEGSGDAAGWAYLFGIGFYYVLIICLVLLVIAGVVFFTTVLITRTSGYNHKIKLLYNPRIEALFKNDLNE